MTAHKRMAAPPRKRAAARKPTAPRKRKAPKKAPKNGGPRRNTSASAKPRKTSASAKKTKRGEQLRHFTPEFLAEAQRRVERTTESTTSIAGKLGMHQSVLWRLIRRKRWIRPEASLRRRGLSPAMRLAAAADALAGTLHPPLEGEGRSPEQSDGGRGGVNARSPALSVEFSPHPGSHRDAMLHSRCFTSAVVDSRTAAEGRLYPPPPGEGSPDSRQPSTSVIDAAAIDRLEQAVLRELATVETMRASLGNEPLRPMDAERTARTLSVLTETLSKLRRLRLAAAPQAGPDHDDMPADIDEFRRDLARRIRAFVASRTGRGNADGDSGPAPVADVR